MIRTVLLSVIPCLGGGDTLVRLLAVGDPYFYSITPDPGSSPNPSYLAFSYISGGENLFQCSRLTFHSSAMWKMSPGKIQFPRTWNNIEMVFFNILSRKLGKNANLFFT